MGGFHKRLSGSKFATIAVCPGCPERCDIAPPLPDTKYSAEGTTVHSAAHQTLIGYPPVVGQRCRDSDLLYTADHIASAQPYIKVCKAVLAESDYGGSEEKLEMTWLDPDVGGTPDFWALKRDGNLVLVDEKDGYVRADADLQLMVYAVGKIRQLNNQGLAPKSLTLIIVQPFCEDASARRIEKHFPDAFAYYEAAIPILKGIIDATKQPNAPRVPNPGCRYCPGSILCPEHKERLAIEARKFFVDSQVLPDQLPPNDVAAELESLKELKSLVASRERAVYAYGFFLADKQGQAIPNHKLIEGRSNREYIDDKEAAALASMFGVTDENIYDVKSPAHLEKLLPKGTLDGLTIQRSKGRKLAPLGARGAPTMAKIHEWFNINSQ